MRTVGTTVGGLCAGLLLVVTVLNCTPGADSADPAPDSEDPTPDVPEPSAPPNPLGGLPGEAVAGLSDADAALFAAGKALFATTFEVADGLGLTARESSCVACHDQPVAGGAGGIGGFRFVGVGVFGIEFSVTRNYPPLFGIGLLGRISDEEILSRQDLDDADGDGITGRANIEVARVGRFGRKAQAATVESIVRGMLANQMRLSSDPLAEAAAQAPPAKPGLLERVFDALASISLASRAYAQASPPTPDDEGDDGDAVPDPEVSDDDLRSLVSYIRNLAAPLRGDIDDVVERGESLFASAGCTACHVPTLETDDGVMIHPYSDLLLHDMGPDADDEIEKGRATGTEFRTQPLWGLGQAGPYLHDGSAATVEEAILQHAGEAEAARAAYEALDESDRQDVLLFLDSL